MVSDMGKNDLTIILCIFFSVILTLICGLFSHSFITLMRIPDDISKDAYSYMFVVLMGTGATVFYNMISNILRALGDSKTPLYFLIVSSVLNILLDILFIIPFKMGVAGAAWATILSQFLSALLSLFMGVKKFEIQMSVMCIGIIVLRHPIVRLFLTKPSHTIYHYSDMYLTVVAPFYFILGLLAVYRTTIYIKTAQS